MLLNADTKKQEKLQFSVRTMIGKSIAYRVTTDWDPSKEIIYILQINETF